MSSNFEFVLIPDHCLQSREAKSVYFCDRNMVSDNYFQGYWQAVISGADFPGHTIQDCLQVIHTDIANVWNFCNPSQV